MEVNLIFISESAFTSKYTLFPPYTKSGYLVGIVLSLTIHVITDDASMGISDNICKLLESIYIQKSNHIFFYLNYLKHNSRNLKTLSSCV